jgi:hypothetical protein
MTRIPSIEVLIISKDRLHLLEQCLLSLAEAFAKSTDMHLSILLGVTEPLKAQYPKSLPLTVFQLPEGLTAPEKRNYLLNRSQADWIFFCDDDVVVSPEIFQNFRLLIEKNTDLIVLGGPNLTNPNSTAEELTQGRFLGSRIQNPLFYPRYLKAKERLTESNRYFCLCNLFVKNTAELRFRHKEFCGEELQLLWDLKPKRRAFLYSPLLWVYHQRRKTRCEFLSQIRSYGKGRGQFLARNFSVSLSFLLLCLLYPFRDGLGLYSAYIAGLKCGLADTLSSRYPIFVKRLRL